MKEFELDGLYLIRCVCSAIKKMLTIHQTQLNIIEGSSNLTVKYYDFIEDKYIRLDKIHDFESSLAYCLESRNIKYLENNLVIFDENSDLSAPIVDVSFDDILMMIADKRVLEALIDYEQ